MSDEEFERARVWSGVGVDDIEGVSVGWAPYRSEGCGYIDSDEPPAQPSASRRIPLKRR